MLHKCVNPACNSSFSHFREGRLFRCHFRGVDQARRIALYWLCGRCSSVLWPAKEDDAKSSHGGAYRRAANMCKPQCMASERLESIEVIAEAAKVNASIRSSEFSWSVDT